MIELDQLKQQLSSYEEPLKEIKASLDLDNKRNRIQELEREMEAPDFWNDPEASTKKTKELKSMKDDLRIYDSLEELYGDIEAYIELGNEE
ncbi:MAG: PCRF domain-containing protein, partial [Lachnospiraceae bacterium]|nr:PCRF domain-containing protein [Lachnospiraceae bacterium]